jgi:hypothetical protein
LQEVRSFKIWGVYNKLSLLLPEERKARVVTVSAGNHAQGLALSCAKLKINFGGVFENVMTWEELPLQKCREVLKDELIAMIGYGVQGPVQSSPKISGTRDSRLFIFGFC